jgi:tetratricopeptide (TPR) repeat protein
VELFRERALEPGSSDSVAAICNRVDRLPLAIELAAARTRLLSPDRLLDRLERRLPILTSGRRDAPHRHHALRDTIAWSHDLLGPDAKRLFGQLGVFVGSFDIDAAEAVCDATLDELEALLEASLVRREDDRFTMLETIREYAVELLERSAVAADVRDRHQRHYLDLAERADAEISGPSVTTWTPRLRKEEDNIRSAIDRAIRTERRADALRLCTAMASFWQFVVHTDEGLRWFDRAFACRGEVDPRTRARALVQFGWMRTYADRGREGLTYLDEAVGIWRSLGDERSLAEALSALCATLSLTDPGRVRATLDEALALSVRTGYARGEARAMHTLGEVLRDDGDFEQAERALQRAIELSHQHGWREFVGASMHSLADLELDRRNLERAAELYLESLRSAGVAGIDRHTAYCLAGLAAVAALRGDGRRASMLWATVEDTESAYGFRLLGSERERYERCLTGVPEWPSRPLSLDEAAGAVLADGADDAPL